MDSIAGFTYSIKREIERKGRLGSKLLKWTQAMWGVNTSCMVFSVLVLCYSFVCYHKTIHGTLNELILE